MVTMKILSVRTKIELSVVIVFLLILGAFSVMSLTRTISDTHDDMDTFIRNSKGNCWSATASNIQTAINDLGITVPTDRYAGARGTVWLPGNTTITLTSTIEVLDYVTLDMGGCCLQPTGNFDVLRLHRGAMVKNGVIDVSDVGTFSHSAICFLATDGIGMYNHNAYVENMKLFSESQRGIGVYLNTSGTANQHISFVFTNNIIINDFQYGIYINHATTGGDNYINGNVFTNIFINHPKYGIKVSQIISEASANTFENIHINCSSATEYILNSNGKYTLYDKIFAFNWDNNSGTRDSYILGSKSDCTYLCFNGEGKNDLNLSTWNAGNNSYCIFDLSSSHLYIGRVTEYQP
jgi:hypothetical protein